MGGLSRAPLGSGRGVAETSEVGRPKGRGPLGLGGFPSWALSSRAAGPLRRAPLVALEQKGNREAGQRGRRCALLPCSNSRSERVWPLAGRWCDF